MQAGSQTPRSDPASDESRELSAVLEALEEGVLATDSGTIRWANAALARMLRQPVTALAGRAVGEVFLHPDGRPVGELSAAATLVRDADGEVSPVTVRPAGGGLFIVIDRSREHLLEREVWRLGERLQGSDDALATDPILRDEVAGMIEHEIRTSATVVRGYLRLLLSQRAGPVDSQQRRFLGEAVREIDRISELVDDLLDVAAAEGSGGLRVIRKPGRLGPIIEGALARARPLVEEREIEILLDLAETDELRLDAERMERVLLNLLTNAVHFAPRGSRIGVSTNLVEADDGPRICVMVEDEGPGIPGRDAERIFEPFVRGEDAGAPTRGVGLGLAFCRRVVEAHGGRIEAVAEIGHGLFRVTLPLGPEGGDRGQ